MIQYNYWFELWSMTADPANNGLAGDGLLSHRLHRNRTSTSFIAIWQVCYYSIQHTGMCQEMGRQHSCCPAIVAIGQVAILVAQVPLKLYGKYV